MLAFFFVRRKMLLYIRKMRLLALILVLSPFVILMAQDHSDCDGKRYRSVIYEDVDIYKDIQFSEGKTITGKQVELFLDVYTPKGDNSVNRPVIVLGFGGSFINGKRTDIAWLCEEYAKRGFVAVSMDYRLYDLPLIPFPSAGDMQTVVVKSVMDMNRAIQFLIDDASSSNTYGIDTSALFVGGVSSGSIMACHTAMLDEDDNLPSYIINKLRSEGLTTDSTTLLGSKDIKGVINFSGALHIGDWYDSSDPPLFSCHDDFDATVPYKSGYGQVFGQNIVELEGSFILDSFANARGMNSELITIPNSAGHVSYFTNDAQRNEIIQKSAVFMYKLLCSDRTDVTDIREKLNVSITPNPFTMDLKVDLSETDWIQVELLDLAGKVIMTDNLFSDGICFKTDSLSKGVYIVRMSFENKVIVKKVIKE